MNIDLWQDHVDHFLSENYVKWSQVNKGNRKKQKYRSGHGTKSYTARRHAERNTDTIRYPSIIDTFGKMHKNKNQEWYNDTAKNQFETLVNEMAAQAGSQNPISEEEVMESKLGSRSGHNRGQGRKLSSGASSSSQSVGSQALRSQASGSQVPNYYTPQ